MSKTTTNKTKSKKSRPSSVYRIWNTRKQKSCGALVLPTQCGDINMPSTSSSLGTVLSHDWPSTKQWYCAIGFILRGAASLPGQSTCEWRPCDAWRTKRLTLGY